MRRRFQTAAYGRIMQLTAEELRVLGALVEKEATTPDQYPLSTNALTTACNQKSSRDPVVSYDQRLVSETMLLLRPAGLARTIVSGRTEKHRHVLDEALGLQRPELAVLAVMMLRGPQAPGELRTRTERSYGFDSPAAVEAVLAGLAERDEPLVRNLGRGPGQSQDRWMHLLGAPTTVDPAPRVQSATTTSAGAPVTAPAATPVQTVPESGDRALERRVAALEERLAALESELGL